MHDAQANLPALLVLVEQGEDVIIAREGKAVARLTACREAEGPRKGGQWRGRVRMARDFDQLTPKLSGQP